MQSLIVTKSGLSILLKRKLKKTHSAQTNIESKLRKPESCGCARSKADEESSIFLFYDHGKGLKNQLLKMRLFS